jgi:predicted NUDIX family NTP pyrophosphohydrolase
MVRRSAGLLMYRVRGGVLEVLLVHPGGPLWAKKDLGAWSIPKGEYAEGEEPLNAARREFEEETGMKPEGDLLPLADLRQSKQKIVKAWAFEGDCDAAAARSNLFSMQWPPGSGKTEKFPEVDRAEWFTVDAAKSKILKAQIRLIEDLVEKIKDLQNQRRST